MSARRTTTDPVEAVLSWLSQEGASRNLPEIFYGPEAAFARAVASAQGPTAIMPQLGAIAAKLQGWKYQEQLQARWRLLEELARLQAGTTFDQPKILDALDQVAPGDQAGCDPFPHEKDLLRDLLDTFFVSSEGRRQALKWRPAHWHLLDFLAEYRGTPLVQHTERTPVLVANNNAGRVFVLVVESAFGPPGLISPAWWKLGLIPFGEKDSFRRAVHNGFRAVIDQHPGKRLRLRWWLEKHPKTEFWFDALGDRSEEENRSVEVAAACAALALLDTDTPAALRPLLDDTVAVSATLAAPGLKTDPSKLPGARSLGKIEYAKNKKDAALRAGLSGVVFAAEQGEDEGPHGNPHERIVVVQSAATLADAYDRLLVTSGDIAQYKESSCDAWAQLWKEEPTPAEFVRASQGNRS